MSLGKPSKNLV